MSKKTYSPYGIISERLIELYAELEKLSTSKHLLNKLNTCIALSEGIEPYIENNTTPESKNLATVLKMLGGSSHAEECYQVSFFFQLRLSNPFNLTPPLTLSLTSTLKPTRFFSISDLNMVSNSETNPNCDCSFKFDTISNSNFIIVKLSPFLPMLPS